MKNLLIWIIAFIVGLAGAIYEYACAAYLTLLFGGSFQQYILSFGVFAGSLGIGATLVAIKSQFFGRNKIYWFIFIQSILVVLAVFMPTFYENLSPLVQPNVSFWILNLIGLIPSLVFGVLIGFELPLLFQLFPARIIGLIGYDFLGMSVGVLAFPFIWLSGQWDISWFFYLAAVLNLAAIAIIYATKNSHIIRVTQHHPSDSMASRPQFPLNQWEIYFLGFLLSFASFAYEAVTVRLVFSVSPHHLQTILGLSSFIVGLSLGALWIEFKPGNYHLKSLLKLELVLTILVLLVPALAFLTSIVFDNFNSLASYSSFESYKFLKGFFLLIFPFSIGYLSGMEMPLIIRSFQLVGDHPVTLRLNAINSMAVLLSGAMAVVIIKNIHSSWAALMMLSLINIFIVCYLIFRVFANNKIKKWSYVLGAFSLFLVMLPVVIESTHHIEKAALKVAYHGIKLDRLGWEDIKNFVGVIKASPEVSRFESPIQVIDLVRGHMGEFPMNDQRGGMYIDGMPQFFLDNHEVYHGSMVTAGLNLFRNKNMVDYPRKILILGGGDGILVAEILKQIPDPKITLVDIDKLMIQLANKEPELRKANRQSLLNPNVTIKIDDAFKFLLEDQSIYDAIFVDLPYPQGVDLLRLYSVEFYQLLLSHLDSNGWVMVDMPLHRNVVHSKKDEERLSLIYWTLRSSGFQTIFAFGASEPFVVLSPKLLDLKFNYKEIGKDVPTKVLINLLPIGFLGAENKPMPKRLNTLRRPVYILENGIFD
ncbi:MAG: hypothetical protein NZ480_01910 [Bdellovibrionaceae bacterium]|nr:hypothetical protein [Pseudobdellovibrionaceae bacterium]MDW8191004.1 hypothetical protein [Pseudobdellovibrionaceae bacterium]